MQIRILIADDHAVVLEGLTLILEARGVRVVGTSVNGRDASLRAQVCVPMSWSWTSPCRS